MLFIIVIIVIIVIFILLFESHPVYKKSRLLLIDYLMSYKIKTKCLLNDNLIVDYELPVIFKKSGIPCIYVSDGKLKVISYSIDDMAFTYHINDTIQCFEINRFTGELKIYHYQLITNFRYRTFISWIDPIMYSIHPSDLLITYPRVFNRI